MSHDGCVEHPSLLAFVGGTEALTIRLRVNGKRYQRPLTHDLLSSLVSELGGRPVKAQIDDMRDNTFYGSVFVRQGDRTLELDARHPISL